MEETTEVYDEKSSKKTDWYVSVRLWQIILCSILTLVLCLSFKSEKGSKIKDGYEYLTGFSLTEDDISDAVQTVKRLINLENG